MKPNSYEPQAGSSRSRRDFLRTTAAGVVAATLPAAAIASAETSEPERGPASPLEEVLNRYGSEFGSLNRVR